MGGKQCPSHLRVKDWSSRKYNGSHLQDSPERLQVAALTLNDGTQDVTSDNLENSADSMRKGVIREVLLNNDFLAKTVPSLIHFLKLTVQESAMSVLIFSVRGPRALTTQSNVVSGDDQLSCHFL